MFAAFIDFALRFDRNGLVRRQRVNRKEARRVSGEPIQREHADPIVNRVKFGLAQEIVFERDNLAERIGMIKDKQVVGCVGRHGEIDCFEAFCDFGETRRVQPRADENGAERVDVAAGRDAAH